MPSAAAFVRRDLARPWLELVQDLKIKAARGAQKFCIAGHLFDGFGPRIERELPAGQRNESELAFGKDRPQVFRFELRHGIDAELDAFEAGFGDVLDGLALIFAPRHSRVAEADAGGRLRMRRQSGKRRGGEELASCGHCGYGIGGRATEGGVGLPSMVVGSNSSTREPSGS